MFYVRAPANIPGELSCHYVLIRLELLICSSVHAVHSSDRFWVYSSVAAIRGQVDLQGRSTGNSGGASRKTICVL
jgi:hypothetical protein